MSRAAILSRHIKRSRITEDIRGPWIWGDDSSCTNCSVIDPPVGYLPFSFFFSLSPIFRKMRNPGLSRAFYRDDIYICVYIKFYTIDRSQVRWFKAPAMVFECCTFNLKENEDFGGNGIKIGNKIRKEGKCSVYANSCFHARGSK